MCPHGSLSWLLGSSASSRRCRVVVMQATEDRTGLDMWCGRGFRNLSTRVRQQSRLIYEGSAAVVGASASRRGVFAAA